MDDLLTLAEVNDDLYLPRGLKDSLVSLLDKHGHDYEIIDECSFSDEPIDVPGQPVLKGEQNKAAAAIVRGVQGRLIMPTGSGKTVVALAAVGKISRPTLILVDKIHIAKQWQERAREHIDYEPGLIGDKTWEEKPITVALLQTLHSRKDKIDTEWWDKWSVVIHDEQHHIPAETYQDIVQRFSARYRIGLSATIGKTEAKKKISELVYGPILFESKYQAIKPNIRVIETDFEFDYHPTYQEKYYKAGKKRKKVVRNNYPDLIASLVENRLRNNLIASRIYDERDNANLIVSRRLAHLDDLRTITVELGFPEERCWMLTGKEKADERMEIYEWADEGKCAIFSTVADEALDIPRLDRLHMTFPQKNVETVKQQLGRIVRYHPKKKDALAYDYVDASVDIIKGQFGHRLRNLYQQQELKVFKITS